MEKPDKPSPEFPLFPHASGQWAKKVRGKMRYFGPWHDPEGARQRWLNERDYWLAGRTPPTDQVTVANLLDSFLGDKEARKQTGDIKQDTFKDYVRVCDTINEALGKRPVMTLGPDDFTSLRVKLAGCSPHTLKRRLTIARMVFAHAAELGLTIRYQKQLNAPSQRTIRRRERDREKLLYSAADIRKLVAAAGPHLKGMILLGINCGFGPTDCITLPSDVIQDGWHNYPRPKTEVERRCPLWPETIEAIEALRRGPRAFNGRRWDRHIVAREFGELCETCEVTNLGFYSLRRTFETIATTARVSQAAINHIMGHSETDMASVYRQEIFDRELRDCAEHVRKWYLGEIQL
jgi:integrase